ncbi:MFS siderochrome iron transporter C [Colletotrichum sp. SAR 10_96]|nr:MFS siderochrome iron transporter C [Colletotrichum sp. SAR 10_96]
MRFITSLKGQFRSDPRPSEQAADDSITVPRTANDVEAAGKTDDGVDDHDADDKIRSSELPPVAKVSNVIGRGQTYIMTISFYVLGYILMASSHGFDSYAAGAIFYTVGQSGTNIMNDIVIADITTARWRGFAISFSFFPFLITPWAAAFIIEDVVRPGGIGWRWGIGMFAILMPIGGAFIISTLLYFQRKAKQEGLAPSQKMTLYSFCSQIDLGGSALLSAGIAMVLLPLTLAAGSASAWQTPYIIALIILGGIILILLPMYEKFLAKHPIMPGHYFRNRTIVLCLFLIASDSIGFSCTHTYFYSWSTVARGFSARDATFFQYTNGVMQCVMGIIAGLAMAYTRRYKWLLISAAVIRMIGYGVMIRLRGADNSVAELFIVQIIQGLGSGIMQLSVLVPAQVVVPHREMPQITALVICFSIIGGSIGACIAGGIYTNTFKPALYRYLGNGASGQLVDSLFDSIVGTAPAWGTPERTAINHAVRNDSIPMFTQSSQLTSHQFSDVMRYMVYTAVGASAPALVLSWFLPDFELPDRNNLVEE